jgi:hypothetical protein
MVLLPNMQPLTFIPALDTHLGAAFEQFEL